MDSLLQIIKSLQNYEQSLSGLLINKQMISESWKLVPENNIFCLNTHSAALIKNLRTVVTAFIGGWYLFAKSNAS